MTTILDTFCDICTRLKPFAILALVPLLLWVHHFETTPPTDVPESLATEPATITGPGNTESRHTDERWAA